MGEQKKPQPVWPLPSAAGKPSSPAGQPSSAQAKPADDKNASRTPPGRVVHDARGHAVWSWSERLPTDSTTHLLRKLESPDLALADDETIAPPAPITPGGGIDPYNKHVPAAPAAPASPAGARGTSTASTPAAPTPPAPVRAKRSEPGKPEADKPAAASTDKRAASTDKPAGSTDKPAGTNDAVLRQLLGKR